MFSNKSSKKEKKSPVVNDKKIDIFEFAQSLGKCSMEIESEEVKDIEIKPIKIKKRQISTC